ncbi:SsrA-binding protein SmpB [Actinocorallia sp. API 0066]|uniref:SsrA-binding protein SmpB n=1 Tax=Actinocorallia sp. API 0066 TaxID=2896846 RepID=UPI001E448E9C|nr:SsrA-binding protein SmpB [Actinocorallia sp. API 0066]MCD0451247.1 SsrA-binding protein SmpB [Actinocorallia sp. API 0066]
MPREQGQKYIAQNKKARFDYQIVDTWEAGMVLTGTEVKSLRQGRASLVDGYAAVDGHGEVYLYNIHIPEYSQGTWTNHTARRTRKLLLNRREISKIIKETNEPGLTLVPLALYFKDGKAKVEIGLARGKKAHDKRQTIAQRDADREMARALRARNRGR